MPQTDTLAATPAGAPFDIRGWSDQEAHEFALSVVAMAARLQQAQAQLTDTARRLTESRAGEVHAKAENILLTAANRGLAARVETLQTANESADYPRRFGHLHGRPDGYDGPGSASLAFLDRPAPPESLIPPRPFRWPWTPGASS